MGDLHSFSVRTELSEESDRYVVIAEYKGQDLPIAPAQSRQFAVAIIQGACLAETEFRFAEFIAGGAPKGFQVKATDPFPQTLQGLRQIRPGAHPWVSAIYGYNTRQPLLDLTAWPTKAQVTMDEARNYAAWLLSAAESAETDNFLQQFCRKVGLSHEEQARLLSEYATYRTSLELESLFQAGD